MADTGAVNARNAKERKEVNDFSELADAFRSSLAGADMGRVQVYVYEESKKKHVYSKSIDFDAANHQIFIDETRYDYPAGGDFMFRLTNQDGNHVAGGTIYMIMAPLPAREIARLAKEEAAAKSTIGQVTTVAPAADSLWRLKFEELEKRQKDGADLTRTIISGGLALAGVIAPLLIKSARNPLTDLKEMMEIQRLSAPPPSSSLKETLDVLAAAKTLIGDRPAGDQDEGFFGEIAKALGPMLAQVVAAQQAGQAAGAAPQAQPAPGGGGAPASPSPAPAPAPAISQPPATENLSLEEQMQLHLIQKFTPIMKRLKALLDKGYQSEELVIFIETQIDTGEVSENDTKLLLSGVNATEEQFANILGIFGITEPDDLATVKASLAAYAERVAADAEEGGEQGDS